MATAVAAADADSVGETIITSHERAANPVYAAIWGPVYVPFPSASPTASPSQAPPAPSLRAAREAAQLHAFSEALGNADAQAAYAFAAMAVARGVVDTYAEYVDAVDAGERSADDGGDGVIPDLVAERPLAIGGDEWPLVPVVSALDTETVASLIVAHDRAQYVYEVVAARSGGEDRARASERALLHRSRAADLVAIAGTDPRGPGYVIDLAALAETDTRNGLLRSAERELAGTYLEALADAPSDDRAWLMSGAHDALAAEAVWPGFAPEELPVLPGHTLP